MDAVALWSGTAVLAAATAFASCQRFMRLEVIDGRDQDIDVPQMLRRRPPASLAEPARASAARHAVWLLVRKELHLQHMTFAVAAVWFVIWLVESALTRAIPGFVGMPLPVVSIMFGAVLALLIPGALASAEERQLGTLEWQMILPMAASTQWAVKVRRRVVTLSLGVPLARRRSRGINAGTARDGHSSRPAACMSPPSARLCSGR